MQCYHDSSLFQQHAYIAGDRVRCSQAGWDGTVLAVKADGAMIIETDTGLRCQRSAKSDKQSLRRIGA